MTPTTTTKTKAKRANLCDYLTSRTLDQLADLCDDPRRAEPGGTEIRAILTYDADNGFFLSAQDGDRIFSIHDKNGEPVKYRTIEQAIYGLQDVLYLCNDVRLDISASSNH